MDGAWTGARSARAGRRLVVFVDDDPLFLQCVRRSVGRAAQGLELVMFENAERMLEHIPSRRAALLVIDAHMPVINGVEACRELRRRKVASAIVVVSSAMTDELVAVALEAGATLAQAKPADLLGLRRLVSTGAGERQERGQLMEDHVDVALNIARGLVRRYGWMLDPDDIQGSAMIGLCEAAAHYDRTRAQPFIAFAEQRIRGAVLDEIRRLGSCGRIVNKRQRLISAARKTLSQTGDAPTDDRVAEHLGLSLSVVQDAAQRSRITGDEVASLPSPCLSPADSVGCAQFLRHLLCARDALGEPDATVIRLHYDSGMSLACIARMLTVTLGRVRHVHARALAKLRDVMCGSIAASDAHSLRDSLPDSELCLLESSSRV
jgi:RNA polymerase sigma factor FliA